MSAFDPQPDRPFWHRSLLGLVLGFVLVVGGVGFWLIMAASAISAVILAVYDVNGGRS